MNNNNFSDSGTADLKLPEEADETTATSETIQTATGIIRTTTYTCGLVIRYELCADKAHVQTNWKIVKLQDGSYAIERP